MVKRLIGGKDDAAALQQQIAALKTEGAEASAEIDRLKVERALAASYDEARDLDDRISRQIWVTEHCAAAIPQIQVELHAARAAQQAQALARHKKALIEIYPKLRAAILAATDAQRLVSDARAAAAQELGEAVVSMQLPAILFAGFLVPDLVALWQQTNDRIIADLARQPKPAAAPVRAALPPPAKPKPPVAVAAEPAPRPKRVVRQDPFPSDGQQALVVFLRAGAELPDGSQAAIGDQVAVPADQAVALVQRGAADYVPAPPAEEKSRG